MNIAYLALRFSVHWHIYIKLGTCKAIIDHITRWITFTNNPVNVYFLDKRSGFIWNLTGQNYKQLGTIKQSKLVFELNSNEKIVPIFYQALDIVSVSLK